MNWERRNEIRGVGVCESERGRVTLKEIEPARESIKNISNVLEKFPNCMTLVGIVCMRSNLESIQLQNIKAYNNNNIHGFRTLWTTSRLFGSPDFFLLVFFFLYFSTQEQIKLPRSAMSQHKQQTFSSIPVAACGHIFS